MKHTLAVLLVAAAAAQVRANSCSDFSYPSWWSTVHPGLEMVSLGRGQVIKADGSAYDETTITGACIAAIASDWSDTKYTQDEAGCFLTCAGPDRGGTTEVDAVDGCAGPSAAPFIAIGWKDDTKTCTCYSDPNFVFPSIPSIDLDNELDDADYGCAYAVDWLLVAACNADQGDVKLDVIVTGEFALETYDCTTTVDLDDTKDAVEAALDTAGCTNFESFGPQCADSCEATVTKITVEGCDADGATAGTINVAFGVEAIVMLADPIDVHIAEEIADDMGALIDTELAAGLDGNGIDIAAAVQADASISGAFTGTVDIPSSNLDDFISKALGDFGSFFPTWHEGDDTTCKNDGTYPEYMSNGQYFKPTLEECCKHYYNWAFTQCMMDGGADPYEYTTYEFYVDYAEDSCVQSCPEDTSDKNCGGNHKNWQATYENAEDCCKDRLFWLNQEECIARSNGEEVALSDLGTEAYYVNWKTFKCVKDCNEDSGDDTCGGLAKGWDQTYTTQKECCSTRLSWTDQCNE